jgi:hypothetical protein
LARQLIKAKEPVPNVLALAGAFVLAFQKPDAIGDYSSPRDIRKGCSKGRKTLIAFGREYGQGSSGSPDNLVLSETAGALRGNPISSMA